MGTEQIGLTIGFLLIIIGLWGILTKTNIIKIILGFTIMDTGINIIIVSIGYIAGRTAPILDHAVDKTQAVSLIVDPVPQALVLTSIVIGFGVTALMLAYTLKLYEKKKSVEINNFEDLKW